MTTEENKILKIYTKNTVKEYFNNRQNVFFNKHLVNPAFRKKILSLQVKNKKILDVGCGYGADLKFLSESGANNLTGIDLSPNCLDKARSTINQDNTKLLIGSIYNLNFSEKFNMIIANLVLDQLENLDKAFSNIGNSLMNGGDFVFSISHPFSQATNDYKNTLSSYFDAGKGEFNPKSLNKKLFYYKRTFGEISKNLLKNNFYIKEIIEPKPAANAFNAYPDKTIIYSHLPGVLIIHAKKYEKQR